MTYVSGFSRYRFECTTIPAYAGWRQIAAATPVFRVILSGTNWVMVAIFAGSFLLLRKTKLSPIAVMVLAGLVNLAVTVAGR